MKMNSKTTVKYRLIFPPKSHLFRSTYTYIYIVVHNIKIYKIIEIYSTHTYTPRPRYTNIYTYIYILTYTYIIIYIHVSFFFPLSLLFFLFFSFFFFSSSHVCVHHTIHPSTRPHTHVCLYRFMNYAIISVIDI